MDKIFGSKPGRIRFLITIVILLSLILLVRFLIFPIKSLPNSTNEVFVSFLDKSATSIFTAVVVGYFLYWVQADEKKKKLEFTESGYEIEKILNRARLTTDKWLFNGGIGRYTKSDTIPKLSTLASTDKKTIDLRIVVLNPFNLELINKYIRFRISVEENSKKKNWTELEVQSEILATIITALYFKNQNQFLNITIRTKDFFTLSRMDISSTVAVITREDPSIPSIILEKDSFMYKHYTEEFQQVERQSTNLLYEFSSLQEPSKQEIKLCIEKLFNTTIQNSTLIDRIYTKFTSPQNPFS